MLLQCQFPSFTWIFYLIIFNIFIFLYWGYSRLKVDRLFKKCWPNEFLEISIVMYFQDLNLLDDKFVDA